MKCALISGLSVLHLACGIIEAVFVSGSTDANGACGPFIYYCMVDCFAFHFAQFFFCFIYAAFENDDNSFPDYKLYRLLAVFTTASGVWSMVCLYYTDSSCVDVFEREYGHLWISVNVEVYIFYASVGLASIYRGYKWYSGSTLVVVETTTNQFTPQTDGTAIRFTPQTDGTGTTSKTSMQETA